MRKSVLASLALALCLTACGADSATDAATTTAADVKQTAAAAVETVSESTTVIRPSTMEALKKMGPEAGKSDFDAAAIVAEFESQFEAGKDFQVLPSAQPTSSDPEHVEVAEVFMYSCPHCYNFEPFIKGWLSDQKPVGVNFIRIPAQFNRPAQLHAAAYYAAEALGVGEQVHLPLFQAIHGNRNPLSSQDAIKKIFTDNGVDGNDFDNAFSSFDVDTKVRQATNLSKRYRIQSVPTLVINGRYVTSGMMAKTNQRLNDIVNYLVAKEMVDR